MTARSIVFRLAATRPFVRFVDRHAHGSVAIFMAHGVYDDQSEAAREPPGSAITLTALKANLDVLRRSYTVISLDEAVDMLTCRLAYKPNCIALTFDDSLKCMVRLTAPLLADMGLTALFFISTEAVEKQEPYWWSRLEQAVALAPGGHARVTLSSGRSYVVRARQPHATLADLKAALQWLPAGEREAAVRHIQTHLGSGLQEERNCDEFMEMLNWNDVRQLCELGMTVGSHTVTHANLALLEDHELAYELAASRQAIEAQCGVECRHLSYPCGCNSDRVRDAVRAAGYASAVISHGPGWNQRGVDLYGLGRFAMPREAHKLPYVVSGMDVVVRKCKAMLRLER